MAKKPRVLHYIHYDKKFTKSQISFLNANFSEKTEQVFFVFGAPHQFFYDQPDNVKKFKPHLLAYFLYSSFFADRIIFNGLFNRKIILLYSLIPKFLKKSVWIPWGYDIYWPQFGLKKIKLKIHFLIQKNFIKNLYAVATQTPGDFDNIKKWYGGNPIYLNATCTIFAFDKSDLDAALNGVLKPVFKVIQIGNSADPSNNHQDIFKTLSKFANKQVNFITPLSYGDFGYREKIIRIGEEIFKKKFRPITDELSPIEYINYLAGVDILVFNHDRQQGFGNLLIALYLGCKVYMKRQISTYQYLTEIAHCHVHDVSKIDSIDYQDFIQIHNQEILKNRNSVAKFFDRGWQKERWEKVFF
jgi:dTDP-N-acetylfucosamine:lipid II N-acetylfucosaminyltransferase